MKIAARRRSIKTDCSICNSKCGTRRPRACLSPHRVRWNQNGAGDWCVCQHSKQHAVGILCFFFPKSNPVRSCGLFYRADFLKLTVEMQRSTAWSLLWKSTLQLMHRTPWEGKKKEEQNKMRLAVFSGFGVFFVFCFASPETRPQYDQTLCRSVGTINTNSP